MNFGFIFKPSKEGEAGMAQHSSPTNVAQV